MSVPIVINIGLVIFGVVIYKNIFSFGQYINLSNIVKIGQFLLSIIKENICCKTPIYEYETDFILYTTDLTGLNTQKYGMHQIKYNIQYAAKYIHHRITNVYTKNIWKKLGINRIIFYNKYGFFDNLIWNEAMGKEYTLGLVDYNLKSICLAIDGQSAQIERTLHHEIFHAIDHKLKTLTHDQNWIKRFGSNYTKEDVNYSYDYASCYARTDQSEDRAELYAELITQYSRKTGHLPYYNDILIKKFKTLFGKLRKFHPHFNKVIYKYRPIETIN